MPWLIFSEKEENMFYYVLEHILSAVVDRSLALYPGVPSLIPGSTSLWDETLSHGLIYEPFKPKPLLVEPLCALRHTKKHKNINPSDPVWVTAKDKPEERCVFLFVNLIPKLYFDNGCNISLLYNV